MIHRDHLDDAIDQVASRMTTVTDDASFASQIEQALPERSAWSRQWWMPRLAITAVLATATALVVLRTFDNRSTDVLRTESASTPIAELPPAINRTIEPVQSVRRTIVEPPSNDRRTLVEGDHEFSLAAIAAPEALAVDLLSPGILPADEPLTITPLAIADLQLSADFSQR